MSSSCGSSGWVPWLSSASTWIGCGLDYRKVRQIIIDECTAEHVNLLESLIGKLTRRLMQLPGVIGVRVKIAKLEIFEDCEVAIRMESGQW